MTKRMRMAGAARLSLALLIAITGASATQKAIAQGEKPAAIVNGDIITEHEFFERLQRLRGQSFVTTDSAGRGQIRKETAGQLTLESMIVERLTIQAANKDKVALTDEETNAQLENLKKQPNVIASLNQHLFTEEMLKQDIRVQGARFKLATEGVTVSADELQKYYKDHIMDYTIPEQWGLSIIGTGNPATPAKIQAELKTGKSFAEEAQLYSEDTVSRAHGGDIGTRAANDPSIPTPWRDAIRTMKPGDISAPVKLEQDPGGGKPKVVTWWLLLLKSKTPETVLSFDEAKLSVQRLALLEKAGGYRKGDEKIAVLRGQSEIKINLSGYESLANPANPK